MHSPNPDDAPLPDRYRRRTVRQWAAKERLLDFLPAEASTLAARYRRIIGIEPARVGSARAYSHWELELLGIVPPTGG